MEGASFNSDEGNTWRWLFSTDEDWEKPSATSVGCLNALDEWDADIKKRTPKNNTKTADDDGSSNEDSEE